MATHDMSLLLDGDAMNVDAGMPGIQGIQGMRGIDSAMALDEVDLFGDPVMDSALASLPARPPPSKPLQQRLDELRTRGCCQGIAWSRQGTIAAISKDAMSIDLRFIRCNPDDGDWDMSEPSPWSAVSQGPSPGPTPSSSSLSLASAGAPFVHLAWSPTTTPDLAVIDALGRLTILTFSITLNRGYLARRWDADPVDDLHAIVGCYWLPLGVHPSRQLHGIHGPAIWMQSEYRYDQKVYPAYGPWHPNPGKSALLCITTNGFLKLFFSQNNNRIEETALELESVTSSDDLITHASLCSDMNTLLIALATASKQLRVVRVNIQWGLPQVDRQVPPGSLTLRPSLRESHVAVTSWFQHGPSESAIDTSMAQLSHVEILPSAPEAQGQVAPAVVLTVRSYIPNDSSPYHQECQSIIDRWEVASDQPQSLHSAFEQLGSKNGAGHAPPNMTRLRKLDPIIIPKIVMAVHTIQLGRILCFAFSDGSVQYRDRFTMNEVYNGLNPSSIMSPLQAGFHFVNDTPCLQIAFSPTSCSFVQICEDWTVKWCKLHYPIDEPNMALQGAQQSAVLAALSLAIAAAGNHTNYDDILAIARPLTKKKPDFTYAWIREIVNMLKFPVDYSEEAHHDQLVRNSSLQLCFSIMNHLGFHGDFQPRSFCGKFAILALNVRNMVILVTLASNAPPNLREKLSPLDEPEVVDALAGCARWAVDLLSWLTDCIFQLLDDPEVAGMLSDPKRFSELAGYLHSRNDVSLHMLLCSSTRGFLSAACRRLAHLGAVSEKARLHYEAQKHQQAMDPSAAAAAATGSSTHPALYQAYLKLQRAVSQTLVNVEAFDHLLGSLGKDIQAAYHTNLSGVLERLKPGQGVTEQQQQQRNEQFMKNAQTHCELGMLLAANPPPTLREVLLKFFTVSLPAFRNQTDPAKLYFASYDLLEVEDDPRSLAVRKAARRYIDVFKRVELTSGPQSKTPDDHVNGVAKNGIEGLPARSGVTQGSGVAGGDEGGNGNKNGNGSGSGSGPQWRRCVRCASVMEDIFGQRPGFTFVLAQQRKCSCGGNWGLLPKGS
ncbi:Mediator of RNA polymerase II transcription subunit 16 [Madurella fahalii]|uniref:Mediator of RNA polymerase II transcription subunit 16 n=1 Tax=Madurella fahalii TaxID=1157608 RepID=A0ABQ0G016_9PEZI